MDARRLAYLKALEIDVWERREVFATSEPQAVVDRRPAEPLAAVGWEELARTVKACTLCPLHATRTQAVFGVGNRNAEWMVIGEAPGADEDRQGEPFVGRAGQLLNSMLKAIGFARSDVYIANILKSRPPNNRDPRPEEVHACIPYLYRQIELIDPKLILCVGRIAAQTLLQTDTPIGKLRGKLHRIAGGRPMIVTYHPAYLLRSPAEKRKSWADLLLAMRTFETLPGTNT
jgi:uracil-DNA glycosylase